ncbi:hypothetical protein BKA65DRAFT_477625 [Rhexocercosporidium sp. MPI-PUGE-AT-0058]|nr:hypothetical protein BKA65DRAFT_477625 [Rhexocercosporidium sp. MPI-PUGE-AT-0058]
MAKGIASHRIPHPSVAFFHMPTRTRTRSPRLFLLTECRMPAKSSCIPLHPPARTVNQSWGREGKGRERERAIPWESSQPDSQTARPIQHTNSIALTEKQGVDIAPPIGYWCVVGMGACCLVARDEKFEGEQSTAWMPFLFGVSGGTPRGAAAPESRGRWRKSALSPVEEPLLPCPVAFALRSHCLGFRCGLLDWSGVGWIGREKKHKVVCTAVFLALQQAQDQRVCNLDQTRAGGSGQCQYQCALFCLQQVQFDAARSAGCRQEAYKHMEEV